MDYIIFLILIGVFYFLWSDKLNIKNKVPEVKNLTLDQQFNSDRVDRDNELDRILEKISRSGIKSLSRKERDFLDKYSNE